MTAIDRMSDGYEPNFDIDLALGKQGELYVAHIVDAMAAGSIEVKTDEMAMKTGRVFVEYECKRFGGWAKSGIATTTAELWAFVIASDTVLVVPTVRLKAAVKRVYKLQPGLRKECIRGSHPTKGVTIPLADIFGHLFKVVA